MESRLIGRSAELIHFKSRLWITITTSRNVIVTCYGTILITILFAYFFFLMGFEVCCKFSFVFAIQMIWYESSSGRGREVLRIDWNCVKWFHLIENVSTWRTCPSWVCGCVGVGGEGKRMKNVWWVFSFIYRRIRFSIGCCRGWRGWTGCCRSGTADRRPDNAGRTGARCESSPAPTSADLPALNIKPPHWNKKEKEKEKEKKRNIKKLLIVTGVSNCEFSIDSNHPKCNWFISQ